MNMLEIKGKIESLSKEIEDIKNDQMKILELKNTVIKIRNSVERTEESIGEYEGRQYKLTYPKNRIKKKKEQGLRNLWDYNKIAKHLFHQSSKRKGETEWG